ncbi:hypothetical protein SOHN41_01995 [Shewanella sp. HN-41]|nr:hypothetical protein SOHN41_01995 [Shewanella sp. HN-41]
MPGCDVPTKTTRILLSMKQLNLIHKTLGANIITGMGECLYENRYLI